MKKLLVLLMMIVPLLVFGCGKSDSVGSAGDKKVAKKSSEQKTEKKAQKKAPEKKELTVEDITQAFKTAGLPIDKITVFTAETDPNKFLGRPGQYIAKASWADTRLQQSDLPDADPKGGTVEIFKTAEELKNRKDYIDGIAKNLPMAVQYMYIHDLALVRINRDLTPEQAGDYENALKAME